MRGVAGRGLGGTGKGLKLSSTCLKRSGLRRQGNMDLRMTLKQRRNLKLRKKGTILGLSEMDDKYTRMSSSL